MKVGFLNMNVGQMICLNKHLAIYSSVVEFCPCMPPIHSASSSPISSAKTTLPKLLKFHDGSSEEDGEEETTKMPINLDVTTTTTTTTMANEIVATEMEENGQKIALWVKNGVLRSNF